MVLRVPIYSLLGSVNMLPINRNIVHRVKKLFLNIVLAMFTVITVGITAFNECSLANLVNNVCCSSRICYTKVR